MSEGKHRVLAQIVGVGLAVLGAFVLWNSMWVSSGIGAFSEEYGESLSHAVDRTKWAEARPNTPPPDRAGLLQAMDGYFGARSWRMGLITAASCEVAGVSLIIASIKPRRRNGPV